MGFVNVPFALARTRDRAGFTQVTPLALFRFPAGPKKNLGTFRLAPA